MKNWKKSIVWLRKYSKGKLSGSYLQAEIVLIKTVYLYINAEIYVTIFTKNLMKLGILSFFNVIYSLVIFQWKRQVHWRIFEEL